MENIKMPTLPAWTMAAEIGYKPKTTFWQDFSIADLYGADAVQDTFNRAFDEWKTDYIYLTELVLVLNHKAWQHVKPGESSRRYTVNYITRLTNTHSTT